MEQILSNPLVLFAAAGVILWAIIAANRPFLCISPDEPLYICIEDGEKSSLYEKRIRRVEFAGVFHLEEFRRVTCVKGKAYLKAQSDWFTNTSGWRGDVAPFTFEKVAPEKAKLMLKEQVPVTKSVARLLKKLERKGQLKPGSGCIIPL